MTAGEIGRIITDMRERADTAGNRCTLTIVRLAVCCGLRVGEMVALRLADVACLDERPHIRVRPEATKRVSQRDGRRRGRGRDVPLWWDAATLADLRAWRERRIEMGAGSTDPYLCATTRSFAGRVVGERVTKSSSRWNDVRTT